MASIGEHHEAIRNLITDNNGVSERVRAVMGMNGPIGLARTVLSQLCVTVPETPIREELSSMTLGQMNMVRDKLGSATATASQLVVDSDGCLATFYDLRGAPNSGSNWSDGRYQRSHDSLKTRSNNLTEAGSLALQANGVFADGQDLPGRAECRNALGLIVTIDTELTAAITAGAHASDNLSDFL